MKQVLDQFGFGVVICDECHYLKNQRAARTKVLQLWKSSRNVFCVLKEGCVALTVDPRATCALVLVRADDRIRCIVRPGGLVEL